MDLAESGSFPASERWISRINRGVSGAETARENSRDSPLQHQGIKIFARHRDCALALSESFHLFNSEWSHLAPTVRLGQTRTLKLSQSCFLPALVVGRQQMEASTSFAVRAGAFPPEQNLRLMLYHSAFVFSYTTAPAQQRLRSRSHRW